MEDRHTITARALLARLQDEPDWVSAIAAELRAVECESEYATIAKCARSIDWLPAGSTSQDAAVMLRALISTEPRQQ